MDEEEGLIWRRMYARMALNEREHWLATGDLSSIRNYVMYVWRAWGYSG